MLHHLMACLRVLPQVLSLSKSFLSRSLLRAYRRPLRQSRRPSGFGGTTGSEPQGCSQGLAALALHACEGGRQKGRAEGPMARVGNPMGAADRMAPDSGSPTSGGF